MLSVWISVRSKELSKLDAHKVDILPNTRQGTHNRKRLVAYFKRDDSSALARSFDGRYRTSSPVFVHRRTLIKKRELITYKQH